MPDVFAHGMLSAAYLGRVLTHWVEPSAIRRLSVRFMAITQLGDEVRCQARVSEKFIQNGEVRLTGSAMVALD